MALSAEDKNSYSIERAVFAVSGLEAGAGVTLSGLAGSAQAFFLASVFKAERRPLLAVLPTAEAAEGFCSDLKFFLGAEDVSFYPATEVLPFDTQPIHQEILASRTEFLFKLLDVRGPTLMVTSADNLMERVVPREGLAEKALTIRLEEETSREALTGRLVEMGYARVPMVEGRGEMSVRGGIVDIFPPGFEHPLRVEFFGDWIESIRLFDVSTQRSVEEIKEGRILPAGATSLSAPSLSSARERLLERADELGLNADTAEHLVPTFKLKIITIDSGQAVQIDFTKFGHDGVWIESRRGTGAWEPLGADMEKPYVDGRPLAVAAVPETREYRLRFWDKGNPNGDWSPVQKVTVGA